MTASLFDVDADAIAVAAYERAAQVMCIYCEKAATGFRGCGQVGLAEFLAKPPHKGRPGWYHNYRQPQDKNDCFLPCHVGRIHDLKGKK